MRVIKWKEDDYEGKDSHSRNQMEKKYKKDFTKHDFVLLTDSEKFIKEGTQFLEGVHHLPEN